MQRSAIKLWFVVFAATTAAANTTGCKTDGGSTAAPSASVKIDNLPLPDPTGADLVAGTIVAATEKVGGIRLYKVLEVKPFPKPLRTELVLVAFQEKAKTFADAQRLWKKGGLSVALNDVRTDRHEFIKRDRRIIATEPVDPKDRKLKRDDKIPTR